MQPPILARVGGPGARESESNLSESIAIPDSPPQASGASARDRGGRRRPSLVSLFYLLSLARAIWRGLDRALCDECGICGLVGRATIFVGDGVGSIPTCGALEVWQWTFGSRTVWLVNKSAGQPQFSGIFQALNNPIVCEPSLVRVFLGTPPGIHPIAIFVISLPS